MNDGAINSDRYSLNSIVSNNEILNRLSESSERSSDTSWEEHSEIPNNRQIRPSTFRNQSLALLQKNISLQGKQKATNICQLVTPIICLLVLLIVKNLSINQVTDIFSAEMDYPYIFNIPYKKLYNNTLSPIKISDCLQWYLYNFDENATNQTKEFVFNGAQKPFSGLLMNLFSPVGNSRNFFYCQSCKDNVPYFALPVNGTINQQIFGNIAYLNQMTYTNNLDSPGLYVLADGAITFYEASPTNLSFKIQINDIDFLQYHRGNGVTKFYAENQDQKSSNAARASDGQMILVDLLSRAYLQMINPNVVLVSGSQYMPVSSAEDNILLRLLAMSESCLYPISLSLLLPVFMYTLVLEKEERLREMMKMNGLKMRNYWITNYFWNLVLYLPSAILFLLFGIFVIQMPFFTDTNPFILALLLLGWGLCQASLSFFYQNFFSRVKTVTLMGYLISLFTVIISVVLNIALFPAPYKLPTVLRIYPPVAFCRLIYDLCNSCSSEACIKAFSELSSEMNSCFISLYVGAFVFLVCGLYLEQVWPQEYGVAKHPLFFLQGCLFRKKKREEHTQLNLEGDNDSLISDAEGDEYVKKEREFVNSLIAPYNDYPLVIKNLRKVYKVTGNKPPKIAVKDFSLHIRKGEIFGLLGPNGAGKTSLISMLIGLYYPERGNAWVDGYDILNQIDLVRTKVGFCPQFDLLWPDLTVREHLLFYSRIRGINRGTEAKMVEKAINEVDLAKFAGFKTRELSGGMKRRLSVAMALVGDPKIIFLDEPTTGLDPENRRQLWDILMIAKGSRAMVLTTHSMEEADVLCTRIGIIAQGALRCIGKQARLKSLYGGGYHLLIHCQNDPSLNPNFQATSAEVIEDRIKSYIKDLLPKATLKSNFNRCFVFHVPLKGLKVSKIFEKLEENKEELGISDWGISQATLEDVFIEVINTFETDINS